MTATPEIWTSPEGVAAELHYVGRSDGEWFAESPGHLPPRSYELRHGSEVVESHTVFPVEPWSPYDAISDRLIADGWTPPPPTEDELAICEHGLSAQLCSGPGHYPAGY